MRVTFDTEVLKNKLIKLGKAITKDPNKELKQSIKQLQITVDNLEYEIKNKTSFNESPIAIHKLIKPATMNYWSEAETKIVSDLILSNIEMSTIDLTKLIIKKRLLSGRTKKALAIKIANVKYRMGNPIKKSNTRKNFHPITWEVKEVNRLTEILKSLEKQDILLNAEAFRSFTSEFKNRSSHAIYLKALVILKKKK